MVAADTGTYYRTSSWLLLAQELVFSPSVDTFNTGACVLCCCWCNVSKRPVSSFRWYRNAFKLVKPELGCRSQGNCFTDYFNTAST